MTKLAHIPTHIAIIMDGNRRWAREHKLPVLAGHKKVADEVLESLIEHAAKLGIKYVTLWAWSTENWKRSSTEIKGIMRIFKYMLHHRWQRLHKKGVRIRIIGDTTALDKDIRAALENVVEQTKNNKQITVVFAFNYGGRDEIIRAINKLEHNPVLKKSTITEKEFSSYLDTSGIPDPESIIRTGGEQRLSGFLLWQSEYSELYFAPWYMPEFTPERLDEVLADYEKRQRRFGK